MFDIGSIELLVVAVIALVVVGPRELPGIIRGLGKAMGVVRNLTAEIRLAAAGLADEVERESAMQGEGRERSSAGASGSGDSAPDPSTAANPYETPDPYAAPDPYATLREKEGVTADMSPEEITRKIMANRRADKDKELSQDDSSAVKEAEDSENPGKKTVSDASSGQRYEQLDDDQ